MLIYSRNLIRVTYFCESRHYVRIFKEIYVFCQKSFCTNSLSFSNALLSREIRKRINGKSLLTSNFTYNFLVIRNSVEQVNPVSNNRIPSTALVASARNSPEFDRTRQHVVSREGFTRLSEIFLSSPM